MKLVVTCLGSLGLYAIGCGVLYIGGHPIDIANYIFGLAVGTGTGIISHTVQRV